jgi:Uma2 family endonuclease
MTVTIPIKAIKISPGSSIKIDNLTWNDFEKILEDLGEKRKIRINYYQKTLEIMSPLAIHERPHRIIADIVKTILDVQGRDWEDFGSTTFKLPEIAGIEPDTCLYIQNSAQVRGCVKMDLSIYPPPDLAIESDVTSKTTLEIYQLIKVPEVWIYNQGKLQIFVINKSEYQLKENSNIFPELNIINMIPNLIEKALNHGTSKMLRELRLEIN